MRELRNKIYVFISSRLNDINLVEDLTQDTILRLVNYSNQNSIENEEAFCIRVAQNLISDHYRKKGKDLVNDEGSSEYNEQIDKMLACQLRYIEELDQESQQLIKKVDLEKVSQKEIAAELNIPYPSLRTKVQRARKKIKNKFESECVVEIDGTGQIISCENKNCS